MCLAPAPPHDLPQWESVYAALSRWSADGTLEALHTELRGRLWVVEGRRSQPTAAIVDSQSVKSSDTVRVDSRGYDAGKKISGRKRHLVADTLGLLLVVTVTSAAVQDRVGARPLLESARRRFPSLSLCWADGGYTGTLVSWARAVLELQVSIARRRQLHSFAVTNVRGPPEPKRQTSCH